MPVEVCVVWKVCRADGISGHTRRLPGPATRTHTHTKDKESLSDFRLLLHASELPIAPARRGKDIPNTRAPVNGQLNPSQLPPKGKVIWSHRARPYTPSRINPINRCSTRITCMMVIPEIIDSVCIYLRIPTMISLTTGYSITKYNRYLVIYSFFIN